MKKRGILVRAGVCGSGREENGEKEDGAERKKKREKKKKERPLEMMMALPVGFPPP